MGNYLAEISLAALAIAVVIAIVRNVNVGPLSLAIALVVGHYIGGVNIKTIISGYPVNVFIMLAGITYLFAIANINGTLEKLTKFAVKGVRGNVALLPIVLFLLAFALSSLGPGAITICALLAAPTMLLASETKIPAFLMAVMVANGTQAGNMSPIAVAGVIVNGLLQPMNITDFGFTLWMNSLVFFFAIGIGAYLLFGGLKLWKKNAAGEASATVKFDVEPFSYQQYLTLLGIAVLTIGVFFFKLDIGLGGFLVGTVLVLLGAADEEKAFKAMPWGAILMVTGVTVLIQLMSKIGGMDLFASIMAKQSTPYTATLVVGFWAALISAYASTIGIILPAFVPMAPDLLAKIGGTDLLGLISSIVLCGHITDVSPLSTLGAIFIANAAEDQDKKKLFRNLLIWGLAMSPVGAIVCWFMFTVLGLP
ncbi:MAG: C4-dicarboxylate ABC transporter [Desulfomonile tiedjei]|uniref:C4-dicarboxylate ABC transporter n=1 Tax=Desulfomonile tiedjei TaxID=2358 RepID=A0A9D6V336_9BACT|nr:C4-dicarboxylate ABC transporter [Desulfomonile tiedjei]